MKPLDPVTYHINGKDMPAQFLEKRGDDYLLIAGLTHVQVPAHTVTKLRVVR